MKKQWIFFLCTLIFCAGMLSIPAFAAEADVTIESKADLLAFAEEVNGGDNFAGKVVLLAADIDLEGMTWTPLQSFAGEFDGNEHTISNFHIEAGTGKSGGFFKMIEAGDGERVHDLTLENVTATVEGSGRFGTLANSIAGIVNRVTVRNVTITTKSGNAWACGMCAFMDFPAMTDCTVENLTVDASQGAQFVAGFAGILQKNKNFVFTNLTVDGFKATVHDTDKNCVVAGFVCETQTGWQTPSIKDCHVSGLDLTVSGIVDAVAGFIGCPGAHTTVSDCTAEGTIDVTGVTLNVENLGSVGGFFGDLGWNDNKGDQGGHHVSDCSADVDITTKIIPAGGFVGSAISATTDNHDHYVNRSMPAEFTNCTATGDITCVSGGSAAVGGFAGNADRGTYRNCRSFGTVNGQSEDTTGSFIGEVKDYGREITIINTNVTGNLLVGGRRKTARLLGSSSNTNVTTDGIQVGHTLSTTLSYNEEGHGYFCTCCEDQYLFDFEEHTFTNDPSDPRYKMCSECGYRYNPDRDGKFSMLYFFLRKVMSQAYTIEMEASDGGVILSDADSAVSHSQTVTYTIIPDEGYEIADVLVDGESVGAVSEYTFTRVKADHTISVVFAEIAG